MFLAFAGYVVLVMAAFLCAYLGSRRAIDKTILPADRDRYIDTIWRLEGFNRSFFLNLLIGSVGLCCTIMPGENSVAVAVAAVLALANMVVAMFVADALQDEYRRLEDGSKYNCVRWWRYVTTVLVCVTCIVALIRFEVASAATPSPPKVPTSSVVGR